MYLESTGGPDQTVQAAPWVSPPSACLDSLAPAALMGRERKEERKKGRRRTKGKKEEMKKIF